MDFSMTWPKHAFEVYDAIIKKDYELANKLNYEVDKPYMDFFAKMNAISSGEDNILRGVWRPPGATVDLPVYHRSRTQRNNGRSSGTC